MENNYTLRSFRWFVLKWQIYCYSNEDFENHFKIQCYWTCHFIKHFEIHYYWTKFEFVILEFFKCSKSVWERLFSYKNKNLNSMILDMKFWSCLIKITLNYNIHLKSSKTH